MAGVPNTLPLQDLNRDAELGRVGCSSCPKQGNATFPSPRNKTNLYNMLDESGSNQTPPDPPPQFTRRKLQRPLAPDSCYSNQIACCSRTYPAFPQSYCSRR